MVKALDYTSRGEDNDIEILVDGSKSKIKKKFLTQVLTTKPELNEYGVYNSETDINANVKTGENEPSASEEFITKLIESIKSIMGSLEETQYIVKDKSNLSFDSLTICISELQTYLRSLEEEKANISSSNT